MRCTPYKKLHNIQVQNNVQKKTTNIRFAVTQIVKAVFFEQRLPFCVIC